MSSIKSKRDIAQKYDEFAAKYDKADAHLELLELRRLRRDLLAQATGNVLEVAVGNRNRQ